jgi:copper oxidase (laccase) domain-containing protein
VRSTIAALREQYEAPRAGLLVGVGPAIRGPAYEVGPDVAGLFPEEVAVPTGDPGSGSALLDLPSFALAEAGACGIPHDNLVDFSLCTSSHPEDLFSHRRGDASRHWAFIGRP